RRREFRARGRGADRAAGRHARRGRGRRRQVGPDRASRGQRVRRGHAAGAGPRGRDAGGRGESEGLVSYGFSSWGLGPWGVDLGLYLMSAAATSERTVAVTLSMPPAQRSTIGIGDATNAGTWFVRRGAVDYHAMSARMLDAVTVEIYTLLKFDSAVLDLEVGSDFLLDASGLIAGSPLSLMFKGCAFAAPVV